ncbi:hypothetical protein T10_2207 [Trichinella papuae]|uniref:Uncharacterized protein n=1 Tax=Trichinella papuae TaxID=268474 RepID=A0A0V1MAQ4_9BILA|nr:hypothetical protein T10_2207 [Trichinella papuae]
MGNCRQKPPAVLAGGVFELGGIKVLLPRLCVYLSQTKTRTRTELTTLFVQTTKRRKSEATVSGFELEDQR